MSASSVVALRYQCVDAAARPKDHVVVIVADVPHGHCGQRGRNAAARVVMAVNRVSVSVEAAVGRRTAIVQ